MRNWPRPVEFARVLVSASLLVFASAPQLALGGMEGTKHNLSKFNGIEVSSTEICVFCHTPQGDQRSAMVPLWAPSERKPSAYSTYDTLGRATSGTTGQIGSVSVACLSCHDETQALGITALAYDHPFGVVYRGESNLQDYDPKELVPEGHEPPPYRKGTRIIDTDFKRADMAVIDESPVWWVDTGEEGRQRTDIQLYTRFITEQDITLPFIECASCHDPHSSNVTFLRLEDNPGDLCLTCHIGKR